VTPPRSPSFTRSWTGSACSPTWRSPVSAWPRWTSPTPRDRTQSQSRRDLRDPRPDEPSERRGTRGRVGPRTEPRRARDVAIMTIASGVGMLAGWSVESRSGARCCRRRAQPQRQSNRPARDVDLRRVNRHLRHRLLVDDGLLATANSRPTAPGRSSSASPACSPARSSTSRATWAGFRAPTFASPRA